jgi:hypothetical protein
MQGIQKNENTSQQRLKSYSAWAGMEMNRQFSEFPLQSNAGESKRKRKFKFLWMAEPGQPILPKRQNGRIIIILIEPAARGGSAS